MLSKNHGSPADKLLPIMQMRGHMPPLCLAEALAQWLSHFYSSILYFIELHNCFMKRVTANKRDKDNRFFVWFSCTSMKKNSFYRVAYMVGTQTLPHCINCSATFLASLSSLTATAKHTNFHKQIREALDYIWSNLWLFPHIHASPFSLTVMAKHTVSPNCDSQSTRLR